MNANCVPFGRFRRLLSNANVTLALSPNGDKHDEQSLQLSYSNVGNHTTVCGKIAVVLNTVHV